MPCCCSSPGPCKWWQKIVSLLVVASILVMAGFYLFMSDEPATDDAVEQDVSPVVEEVEVIAAVAPLSYSLDEVDATAEMEEVDFGYTVEGLTAMATECASEHKEGYFEELVATYDGAKNLQYTFTYDGESQDSGIYSVSLLPNLMNYADLEAVNADFGVCAAGGEYPHMVNEDWLVWTGSCGSGFDDGLDLPHGCQVVKDAVEPTLKLK